MSYLFVSYRRHISKSVDFERTMLSNEIVSTPLTQFKENHNVSNIFKDTYLFEFLDLPEKYYEKDLKKALVTFK